MSIGLRPRTPSPCLCVYEWLSCCSWLGFYCFVPGEQCCKDGQKLAPWQLDDWHLCMDCDALVKGRRLSGRGILSSTWQPHWVQAPFPASLDHPETPLPLIILTGSHLEPRLLLSLTGGGGGDTVWSSVFLFKRRSSDPAGLLHRAALARGYQHPGTRSDSCFPPLVH